MGSSFANSLIANLGTAQAAHKTIILTIATTNKKEDEPYLTPIREFNNFIVAGCILFKLSDLYKITKLIADLPDLIFIDNENYLRQSDADLSNIASLNSERYETLFNASIKHFPKAKIFEYKPSDLTVNAAWSFITQKLGSVSGRKISIIGAGNIGSKLALKLTESGGVVTINRRNSEKGTTIANGLNNIKSSFCDNPIKYVDDKTLALQEAEIVIGASNGIQVIHRQMLKDVSKDCMFLDLGKNNFSTNAIELINQARMQFYRTDVTAALEGMVTEAIHTRKMIDTSIGRKKLSFCTIISGGVFGAVGEVVVDDISDPKIIFGISRGDGTLKKKFSAADIAMIQKLKNMI